MHTHLVGLVAVARPTSADTCALFRVEQGCLNGPVEGLVDSIDHHDYDSLRKEAATSSSSPSPPVSLPSLSLLTPLPAVLWKAQLDEGGERRVETSST